MTTQKYIQKAKSYNGFAPAIQPLMVFQKNNSIKCVNYVIYVLFYPLQCDTVCK